jgi:hypothetical protein
MSSTFTRRELAQMGVLAGVAGLASGTSLAAGAPSRFSLPTDPAEQNRAMVRLLGTSGEDPVIWSTRGKVFAVKPDGVAELYGMHGSESAWWRQVDDATWVRYSSTVSFFTDIETGEFIDEVKSPFNGKNVKLPASFIRHKEGEWYTPTGHYYGSMKKVFPDHYPDKPLSLEWSLDGDVIRLRSGSKFPPILPQPSLEFVTMFGDASQVFDPAVTTPMGRTAGWNIFSAVRTPYAEMDILPGHVIWHFDAVKVASFDDLDPEYRNKANALTERFEESPQFDEGPSFFERILAARGNRAES